MTDSFAKCGVLEYVCIPSSQKQLGIDPLLCLCWLGTWVVCVGGCEY